MKSFMSMVAIVIAVVMSTTLANAQTRTRGHWRDTNRDGVKDTYVNPYSRTNPDSSRMNNYSYPGNYNPNSGDFTPRTNSPRETYPSNPNPYERRDPYRRY